MEIEMLRQTARRFVADRVTPGNRAAEHDGALPAAWWEGIRDLDLTGLLVPPELGGAGAGIDAAVVVAEELAAGSAALAWTWLEHTASTWLLAALANEGVKTRLLPRLAAGEVLGSALKATEAGGGSNPAAITTTARATAGGYVLDGRKVFQGLAGTAGVYLVVARTEPTEAGPLSVFVVEQGTPGLSFGAREQTMGLQALAVAEIVLDSCAVPAENLLGPLGGLGAVLAQQGRVAPLLVAAVAVGLAGASVDETLTFLGDRVVAGQRLADLPVLQLRVADVLVEIESARGLLERAVRDPARPGVGMLTKVAASEAAARVIDRCLLLHGLAGYSAALPIEQRARDVRALAIHYGTNDQLRQLAAQMVLRAPRR